MGHPSLWPRTPPATSKRTGLEESTSSMFPFLVLVDQSVGVSRGQGSLGKRRRVAGPPPLVPASGASRVAEWGSGSSGSGATRIVRDRTNALTDQVHDLGHSHRYALVERSRVVSSHGHPVSGLITRITVAPEHLARVTRSWRESCAFGGAESTESQFRGGSSGCRAGRGREEEAAFRDCWLLILVAVAAATATIAPRPATETTGLFTRTAPEPRQLQAPRVTA